MPAKAAPKTPTPEAQLRSFTARFDPKAQVLFRSVRTALRKRFPTANELAYDYANQVLLSYSPTEGGIDAVASLAVREEGVRLYLGHATRLPDPKRLLRGTGKQARFIEVTSVRQLADPDVAALIDAAVGAATKPLPATGDGTLIIRTGGGEKAKPAARSKTKK